MYTFSMTVPRGRSIVEHINLHLRDFLLAIPRPACAVLVCSPAVAAHIDAMQEGYEVEPGRYEFPDGTPKKVGTWRGIPVYADPLLPWAEGYFASNLEGDNKITFALEDV